MSRKKPRGPWLEQPRDELGRFARVKKSVGKKGKKAVAKPPAKVATKPKAKAAVKPPAKVVTKPKAKVATKPKAKAAAKPPAKVATKPKAKAAAKPPAKVATKPKAKVAAKPPAKLATKPPTKVAAKPPAKVAAKPPAKVAAKPPAKAAAKPKRKAPAKAVKPKGKIPVRRPAKGPARDEHGRFTSRVKPPRLPRKPAPPKVKKPEYPHVADRSRAAEREMQSRLLSLMDSILLLETGLDMAVQTMINIDGTVDGELTIRNLPDEWREEKTMGYLVATLSSALRTFVPFESRPAMGGAFWCSFGVRFGPQNEAEIGELYNLYKRHRGLFQIGTYPTPAWGTGALQIALVGNNVGLKAMLESLMKKRGLPPSVVMIRFIWTPDGERPGHYKGEK